MPKWGIETGNRLEFVTFGCYNPSSGSFRKRERLVRGMKRKILWLMSMAALCLVLYTIVVSRLENGTNIIFGGQSGAFIRTDSANYNVTPTPSPEPTVDIWPKLSTKDFPTAAPSSTCPRISATQ